ncbi:hypothetical protein KAR91_08565 [Candidatus Pacearchaeota archaeon]|nr:hypothetical protein [Candidatus Pacearchaeota archaeon]
MGTVQYYKKDVYGKALYYPANATAKIVCNLVGAKTLNNVQLATCEQLGFAVEQVPQP